MEGVEAGRVGCGWFGGDGCCEQVAVESIVRGGEVLERCVHVDAYSRRLHNCVRERFWKLV